MHHGEVLGTEGERRAHVTRTAPIGAWRPPFALTTAEDLGFDEAIGRVEAALRLGIDPSLEPVRAVLAELGNPERAFRSVQVAGTNGKTSTSRYTASLLSAAGHRCGLYTSPHLVDYTERVEVAGAPVSREVFARGVSWALAAWRRVAARDARMAEQGCTEFELLTAAAMVVFAAEGVDVAVLEVGLGGRWDATSAVPTSACAVTGIGLDHTHILGGTLEAIAAEKAAVIHAGNPCVLGTSAVRPQGVLDVMRSRCAEVGIVPTAVVELTGEAGGLVSSAAADLPCAAFRVTHRPEGPFDELVFDVDVALELPDVGSVRAAYPDCSLVAPAYQAQNAACALALATAVSGRALDATDARAALATCPVPGRFEVLCKEPLVVLDACHNPQSAAAFARAVTDAWPDRAARPALVLGALADKDHAGIVGTVAPLFDRIVVTQSDSPRAVCASDLAGEVERVCGRAPEAVFPLARDAVLHLCGEPFVACGTITLIGDLAALLR